MMVPRESIMELFRYGTYHHSLLTKPPTQCVFKRHQKTWLQMCVNSGWPLTIPKRLSHIRRSTTFRECTVHIRAPSQGSHLLSSQVPNCPSFNDVASRNRSRSPCDSTWKGFTRVGKECIATAWNFGEIDFTSD